MIKELHGKHYYLVLNSYQEVINVTNDLAKSEKFKDEFFIVSKISDDKWVIYSEATCGSFRGPKYSAWELIKRRLYKTRA